MTHTLQQITTRALTIIFISTCALGYQTPLLSMHKETTSRPQPPKRSRPQATTTSYTQEELLPAAVRRTRTQGHMQLQSNNNTSMPAHRPFRASESATSSLQSYSMPLSTSPSVPLRTSRLTPALIYAAWKANHPELNTTTENL